MPRALASRATREIDDYHYVFGADCEPYMTWQARALYDSWLRVGSPGRITRVLTCDDARASKYEHMDVVPDTLLCENFAKDDEGDHYAAYNMPGGFDCWARERGTTAKWVVKLDADMLLRKPLSAREIHAERGVAAAGEYGYLSGVTNGMAKFFIEDEEALGRLAKVGGWEIFDATDFMRLTPLWMEYTRKVRKDPRVWYPYRGTGDAYVTAEHPRPWISEMYGFIFGAAVSGVSFNVMPSTQLYAGMAPWDEASADPYIVHYGIKLAHGKYEWDKHDSYGNVERMSCESTAKPFPVIDEPKQLREGATPSERYAYIFIDIMHFTVKSINESVEKYTRERCGRRPAVLSRDPEVMKPERGAVALPQLDAVRSEQGAGEVGQNNEPELSNDVEMAIENSQARSALIRMWMFSICVWVFILAAFVRPRLMRKKRQLKYDKSNAKNPFRNV